MASPNGNDWLQREGDEALATLVAFTEVATREQFATIAQRLSDTASCKKLREAIEDWHASTRQALVEARRRMPDTVRVYDDMQAVLAARIEAAPKGAQ